MLAETIDLTRHEPESKPYDIGFSSLRFRIHGLTAEQGKSALQHYSLPYAETNKGFTEIYIDYQTFNVGPASDYTGVNGYEPLLEFHQDWLKVEGIDFRGTIQLNPVLEGKLVCNESQMSASSTAYENYLRMITTYALIKQGGSLMHSAAMVLKGKAYLFIGRSNAGKTTISHLALAFGAQILSDDANVIQKLNDSSYWVDAVPFAGELGQQAVRVGGPYPLAGIFVLEKSDHNEVVQLSESQKIASLLVSTPVVNKDPYRNSVLLDNLEAVVQKVPVATLKFIKSQGFAEIYRCITNSFKKTV